MKREIKTVNARSIHSSGILPPREHGGDLSDSVKRTGVQQPIIVRPYSEKPDEYEIIDGVGRRMTLKDDEQVLIDVRYNIEDSGVFSISHATFQRKDRSAYETALFYAAWLKTLEKEKGTNEGLQALLAKQANLSESALSQYIAIDKLFERLRALSPDEEFSKLKTWSVNKLYKLSELPDNPHLVDVARLFESKSETSIEEVEETVNRLVDAAQFQEIFGNENQAPDDPQPNSLALQQTNGEAGGESKKSCLSRAKKVESLATETHKILDTTIQGLVNNIDKCSSEEVLQMLNGLLRILRKLKNQFSVLQQKMKFTQ